LNFDWSIHVSPPRIFPVLFVVLNVAIRRKYLFTFRWQIRVADSACCHPPLSKRMFRAESSDWVHGPVFRGRPGDSIAPLELGQHLFPQVEH